MQPVRKDSRELQTTVEELAALREELTQRTRDVRKFAEMLAQEKQVNATLRSQAVASPRTGNRPAPPRQPVQPNSAPVAPVRRAVSISKADAWMLIKTFLFAVAVATICASIAGTF
jgi:Tfp pilus assembly protein FimV